MNAFRRALAAGYTCVLLQACSPPPQAPPAPGPARWAAEGLLEALCHDSTQEFMALRVAARQCALAGEAVAEGVGGGVREALALAPALGEGVALGAGQLRLLTAW